MSCSFCGGIVAVESLLDPMEQTRGYAPFTVSPVQARAALQRWLGSLGWFRPSDLQTGADVLELRPLYWVAWVFDTDCRISWTADSNAGAGRSAWAPHAGQETARFQNVLVSASRGLSVRETDVIGRTIDLSTVQDQPGGVADQPGGVTDQPGGDDATTEQFDVARSQARRQVRDAVDELARQHVQNHFIPGTRFRNVKVSVVVQGLVTRRLSLPAYVMAYRYRETLYRVVISGQNTTALLGTAPYSMAKIALAVIGAVAVGLIGISLIAAASG